MNGTMLIRPATEHDLPAILAIVNQVIANTLAIYAYAPQTLEEREKWFRGVRRPATGR